MTLVGATAHTARTRRHGHSAPRGQFFTLGSVARFLWQVVESFAPDRPRLGWRTVDPAAGAGVLLDAGCDGGWTGPERAVGIEIDPGVAAGRPAPAAPIQLGDGLLDRPADVVDGSFDLAVGNPPFGRARELLSAAQQERLLAAAGTPLAIWGPGLGDGDRLTRAAGNRRVEQLFLARCLELVRDEGLVACIVPDSLLANGREQPARDWLARRAQLLAAVALPASAFRRPGLNAYAHLVLLRKAGSAGGRVLLLQRRHAGRGQLQGVLDGMLADLRRLVRQAQAPGGAAVLWEELRGRRWDAGYWVGRGQLVPGLAEGVEDVDLGGCVELLIYGPIVTGGPTAHVPGGVRSIRQADFTETGLRPRDGLRVEPGSAHDPPPSRVRRGDVLLPRSGSGSLGRNRVAVYDEDEPANVGCFVDLIRLRPDTLNPYYLWLFLRSRHGWGQIRSLISGVGTPNINFAQIRSLRISLIPMAEQVRYERAYRDEVLPLHLQAADSDPAGRRAQDRFRCLVERLEDRLGGRPGAGRGDVCP